MVRFVPLSLAPIDRAEAVDATHMAVLAVQVPLGAVVARPVPDVQAEVVHGAALIVVLA